MENTLELVKYLMDELVKVKVANQRWIDKDEIRSYKWEQDRQRIKELEAQVNDNSEELSEDEFGQIMYK